MEEVTTLMGDTTANSVRSVCKLEIKEKVSFDSPKVATNECRWI